MDATGIDPKNEFSVSCRTCCFSPPANHLAEMFESVWYDCERVGGVGFDDKSAEVMLDESTDGVCGGDDATSSEVSGGATEAVLSVGERDECCRRADGWEDAGRSNTPKSRS